MSYEQLTHLKAVTRTAERLPPETHLPVPEIETAEKEKSAEHLAREICQCGDYRKMLDTFALPENAGLFEGQIRRMKEFYGNTRLHDAERSGLLQMGDWEMLTILELFDHSTFEHSLRMYEKVHQKLHSGNSVERYLSLNIAAEDLSPRDIELACLLHDIGKINLVPKDLLLNNTLSENEWHERFKGWCHENLDRERSATALAEYQDFFKMDPDARAVKITPLFVALTPKQDADLRARGIRTSWPLARIIEEHPDISADIVARYHPNNPIISLIRDHHERPLHKNDTRRVSESAVRISDVVVDTLRLADVFDAYHHSRPYKKEFFLMDTFAYVILLAEHGFIDCELAAYWILDEQDHFDQERYIPNLKAHNKKEIAAISNVEDRQKRKAELDALVTKEEDCKKIVKEFLIKYSQPELKKAA